MKKHRAHGAAQEESYKSTLQKGHSEQAEKKRFKTRLEAKVKQEKSRKALFRKDEASHKQKAGWGSASTETKAKTDAPAEATVQAAEKLKKSV